MNRHERSLHSRWVPDIFQRNQWPNAGAWWASRTEYTIRWESGREEAELEDFPIPSEEEDGKGRVDPEAIPEELHITRVGN